MHWQPISLQELNLVIEKGEQMMTPTQLHFWQQVKISPEKWTEETLGKEGGGFWIVALVANKVLYYNDIEEGFNISLFEKRGVILNYFAEQDELHFAIYKFQNSPLITNLYLDDLIIGEVILYISDESMGVLSGNLIPNEHYEKIKKLIFNQFYQKGISNRSDFKYKLITKYGNTLNPQGGIGITHSQEFQEEILVDAAGNDMKEIKKIIFQEQKQ